MLLISSVGFALVLVLGACGGSAKPSGSPTTQEQEPGSTAHVVKAAGADPSASAQMICADEAVKDISSVVGVNTVSISKPTWIDHTYSCDYVYSGGTRMKLSVKELDDEAATTKYYDDLGKTLGHKQNLQGLGQGSYTTNNGVVVRKDYKVLTVDVSRMPA
jgi:hypothetical protein